MEPPRTFSIAGIAGSLRKASYNRALLAAAAELSPPSLAIRVLELRDVPLYDADVEAAGAPPAVVSLREAVRAADGILFATPEYNHGVPGVLKNAVDWLSRPPRASALNDKPVAIMGASPGMWGTARGQSQLRQAFVFTNSFAMPQPEVLVARAADKFDPEGKLTDAATREHLAKFLGAFAEWVARFVR